MTRDQQNRWTAASTVYLLLFLLAIALYCHVGK